LTEHPILFSAPMVRAILEGRKTQTRLVIKPVRGYERHNICNPAMAAKPWTVWWHGDVTDKVGCLQTCPLGIPGDWLWVRERFGWSAKLPVSKWYDDCTLMAYPDLLAYGADAPAGLWCWKGSTQMPRWASRITLEITDVRVQRVQAITSRDIEAEGIDLVGNYRAQFCELWDSTNVKRGFGWAVNPWVWAVSFRRIE
jgi:hypothetical protein